MDEWTVIGIDGWMGGWIGIDMLGVRNPRLLFDGPYEERDRPWVNTLCYSSADQDSDHER